MKRLIESEEWSTFVAGVAGGSYCDSGPVMQLLGKEDVAYLVKLLGGGAGEQRDAALKALFTLCMRNNPGVRPAELKHLCPVLKQYVDAGYSGN